MKRILTLGILALFLMGFTSDCEGKLPTNTTPKGPPPDHALSVRAYAEPNPGLLFVSITGTATGGKGKIILQAGDVFPMPTTRVRNPFIQTLHYPPGVLLSVTITVTAPNTQVIVGCEIIDRGESVVLKQKEVAISDRGTVVTCGPYTTRG